MHFRWRRFRWWDLSIQREFNFDLIKAWPRNEIPEVKFSPIASLELIWRLLVFGQLSEDLQLAGS
jgi:hypothetical protein